MYNYLSKQQDDIKQIIMYNYFIYFARNPTNNNLNPYFEKASL